MTITRRDSCKVCKVRISIKRNFDVSVNMFDQDSSGITPEIKKQIIAFREEPALCDKHQDKVAA